MASPKTLSAQQGGQTANKTRSVLVKQAKQCVVKTEHQAEKSRCPDQNSSLLLLTTCSTHLTQLRVYWAKWSHNEWQKHRFIPKLQPNILFFHNFFVGFNALPSLWQTAFPTHYFFHDISLLLPFDQVLRCTSPPTLPASQILQRKKTHSSSWSNVWNLRSIVYGRNKISCFYTELFYFKKNDEALCKAILYWVGNLSVLGKVC